MRASRARVAARWLLLRSWALFGSVAVACDSSNVSDFEDRSVDAARASAANDAGEVRVDGGFGGAAGSALSDDASAAQSDASANAGGPAESSIDASVPLFTDAGRSQDGALDSGDPSSRDSGAQAVSCSGVSRFTHPGVLHGQAQLARVRAGIAAHTEPYASAWAAFHPPSSNSQGNPPTGIDDTNAYALQDQGHTMYQLAVYWALTGDAAYGSAAAGMLNAWSKKFTGPNVAGATLRVGLGAIQMINAAELLRYANGGFAGFSVAEDTAFTKMLTDAVYPTLHSAWQANGDAGWGTPSVAALAAAAIHTENCAWLGEAIEQFRNNPCVSIYQIVNDGRHGGSQYIGENAESGRDQGHVQGTVAHLAETAEMAWNQGVDLYGEGQNLLLSGMDYNARYNLGNDVPFTAMSTCTSTYRSIATDGRGSFSPVYEMVWNHYHNRRGLPATYIGQVRAKSSYAPEASNGDHVGLGTLLYTRPLNPATALGE